MPLLKINDKLLHFVHIPKTGGSCITSYLRAKGPLALYSREPVEWSKTTPQHMEAATQRMILPYGFCDHRFCILRDPFERLLSEYRYRATRINPPEALPEHIVPGDTLTVELDWGKEFCGTFDAWVAKVFADQIDDPYLSDNHIRPQAEFTGPDVKIFLFEEGLEQVFRWVDHITQTDRAIVPLDRNSSVKFSIQMLEQTRESIESFYQEDLQLIHQIKAARRSALHVPH
ncbi:sulfotransferase family 2 domain-containing protein [Sulfitobacter dubius]|uniref:sulfotransferase family 2 domain-containing protein n=1 Tax=Sulfitobacter dubius TaxID=218673 RepID=UPI0008EBE72B|nr:sulfotransferase family 2 domain-containing protein [Sulfitobacter dubius]SFH34775.1 Sulfotransferase family protein [Sulfitobacter dubius]